MNALVLLASGTDELEAVTVINILRRGGIDVTVAGDGDVVTCSRGVRIIPDIRTEEISEDDVFDVVVLPGGSQGVESFIESSSVEGIVNRQYASNKLLAALCAAPAVLHEFGVLSPNTIIAVHPNIAGDLGMYKQVSDRVVLSGNILTSRGAGTAMDFALEIVRMLEGAKTASFIATDIVLYE
jgi:DJ-1 family protein